MNYPTREDVLVGVTGFLLSAVFVTAVMVVTARAQELPPAGTAFPGDGTPPVGWWQVNKNFDPGQRGWSKPANPNSQQGSGDGGGQLCCPAGGVSPFNKVLRK